MATKSKKRKKKRSSSGQENVLYQDIIILLVLAISILLFISNFGVGGVIGNAVSAFFFGVFGLMAYVFPALLFIGTAFYISNKNNALIRRKMSGALASMFFMCGFLQLITVGVPEGNWLITSYRECAADKIGGGITGAFQAWLFSMAFGTIGAYVIVIIGLIIAAIIMTQRPVISSLRSCGETAYRNASKTRKEKPKRLDKKPDKTERKPVDVVIVPEMKEKKTPDFLEDYLPEQEIPLLNPKEAVIPEFQEEKPVSRERKKNPSSSPETIRESIHDIKDEIEEHSGEGGSENTYEFPPLGLLKRTKPGEGGNDSSSLKATALKLQQTLKSFGVNVTITDVSCGPKVTRYELQPEQGVKVNKIVSLADDIKLNLAAEDIRIEAPIPGKAAVGIEVPNKKASVVLLRDLLESEEFKNHPSNIAFAVGKDIGGKTVVADIAKMPHLLIAGATGSGKSVCINTLIMSIIYKAHPEDVKLIMIDPKVVELSVYNGIPHLYIPVVTEPKKAAGALNWAVAEMTERYNKFAEYGVRDLKGYNAKVETVQDIEDENKPQKLPQIVIIVDELADLMMVAPGEVESAICRLAQLARAAGIHLIIATQRPSVDVITGLIKANMPSRIAFMVSSGVDSRTILDMNGAEKLLGNGDMLFSPQGYSKPARVQGAFVSDKEVEKVVDFLNQTHGVSQYDTELEEKISQHSAAAGATGSSSDERDAYFQQAGRFIIEKDKASIGMLQRMFKIGFNRAARIMDQLSDAGVVGPEEGTKPRKVLMSMEEFEKYIEECF